ncbi:MAG: hypothetical protein E6G47_01460 [Actinobacteria bacterium]|nr:MAG: hypothetical protein E6G47_01460 [Actinomycetota bacterium]
MVEQSYSFGGHLVGIRTTSEPFGAWLDETLAEYRAETEAPTHYSIVVEDPATERRGEKRFHILYRGTITVARTLDLTTVGRLLLSELELSMLDDRDDLIFVEAIPVAANGVSVLVPSILVSYVASLGRRVGRAGLSLPAHAYVAVDPARGAIVPPPPVLVDVEAALGRLAELVPAGAPDGRLVIDRSWPVDVVCSIGEGEPGRVTPVSRAIALHRLTSRVVNLQTMKGDAIRGLARLVGAAECRQVSTARAEDIVDAVVAETRAVDGNGHHVG